MESTYAQKQQTPDLFPEASLAMNDDNFTLFTLFFKLRQLQQWTLRDGD